MSWEPPVLDAVRLPGRAGIDPERWVVTRELPDGSVLTEIWDHPPETHEMRLTRRAGEAEAKLRDATRGATDKRHALELERIARAQALHASGLKPAQIALRMAREVQDARGELVYSDEKPLDPTTVRRWLRVSKSDTTP